VSKTRMPHRAMTLASMASSV